MRAIKPSGESMAPLKVTPGVILSGSGHGGTSLPDSPPPLAQPLNHHHSGHLPDRWRDLSPVRCVPLVADSPNEAGSVAPPLFPVIKPSPPRRDVERGSSCRLAPSPPCLCSSLSRSCDRLNSCSFQWERSSLLDRRGWRRFDSPVCPTVQRKPSCQTPVPGLTDLHSRKKTYTGPRLLLLLQLFQF